MALNSDIVSLCRRLRGEHLLVSTEVESLTKLNEQLNNDLQALYENVWICCAQQVNLIKLVHSHPDATPENSCSLVNRLCSAEFIPSYQRLQQHDPTVANVLRILYANPALMAKILEHADVYMTNEPTADGNLVFNLCYVMFSAVYGCCMLPSEERLCLQTLNHLMQSQIVTSQMPRRILGRATCAFSRLYKFFADGLFSAKVFLTAALHESIMEVLSQDELFLDIDPSKTLIRFKPDERLKKFGEPGSEQYMNTTKSHRITIVNKLVLIASKFVDGVTRSMMYFPAPLAWLVRTLHNQLTTAGRISEREITLICTDLVITCFICPAITNPEPLGIIADTPISPIARFNLMQIGQILQTLAVLPGEQVDDKVMDLYSQFEQDCMSSVISNLMVDNTYGNLDSLYPDNTDDWAHSLARNNCLITENELKSLLNYLHAVSSNIQSAHNDESTHQLFTVISSLPAVWRMKPDPLQPLSAETINGRSVTPTLSTTSSSLTPSPGNKAASMSSSAKKTTTSIVNKVRSGSYHRLTQLTGHTPENRSSANQSGSCDDVSRISVAPTKPMQVLVVRVCDERATVGLIGEDTYMHTIRARHASHDKTNEKRARFVETESIGTSEQDTEACSDRASLSSSLDGLTNVEDVVSTVADNMSDVDVVPLSANVSGRASPSISGRETPLSTSQPQQPNPPTSRDGDENEDEEEVEVSSSRMGVVPENERRLPSLPVTVQKPRENREDIEDKFGKFGLPQNSDDTHSLVSDSWSTDVVASDNEGGPGSEHAAMHPPGGIVPAGALPDIVPGAQAPDMPRLHLIREEQAVQAAAAGAAAAAAGGHAAMRGMAGLLIGDDRSDTWSVDAIASDSEADTNRQEDEIENLRDVDNELTELEQDEDAQIELAVALSLEEHAKHQAVQPIEDQSDSSVAASAAMMQEPAPEPPEDEDEPCDDSVSIAATAGSCRGGPIARRPVVTTSIVSSTSNTSTVSGTAVVTETNSNATTNATTTTTAPISTPAPTAPATANNGGLLSKENLRRQSSGSSFYSKSDVDSEFIGDYPDDTGSTYTSEFPHPPSSRGSFGDASAMSAPAASRMLNSDTNAFARLSLLNNQDGDDTPEPLPMDFNPVVVPPTPPTSDRSVPNDDSRHDSLSAGRGKHGKSGGGGGILRSSPPTPNEVKNKRVGVTMSSSFKTHHRHYPNASGEHHGNRVRSSTGSASQRSNASSKVLSSKALHKRHSSPIPSVNENAAAMRKKTNFFAELQQKVGDSIRGHSNKSLSPFQVPDVASSPGVSGGSANKPSTTGQNVVAASAVTGGGLTADEIMSKYQSMNTSNGSAQPLNATRITVNGTESNATSERVKYYDANNPTRCQAFLDAKRKLRVVLCSIDVECLPCNNMPAHNMHASAIGDFPGSAWSMMSSNVISVDQHRPPGIMSVHAQLPTNGRAHVSVAEELMRLLRLLLAEATNTQQQALCAQLTECIRCLSVFDQTAIKKLVRSIKEEHRLRSSYVTYLQQSRVALLHLRAFAERLRVRVQREQLLSGECMIQVLARLFLHQHHEQQLNAFINNFMRLVVQDEKNDLVEQFLHYLYEQMNVEPSWTAANGEQVARAHLELERMVIARIYVSALYPNGDADVYRDQMLHDTIGKLRKSMSAQDPALGVPDMLMAECPWPSAQAAISLMNVFKSPRDKLACITRCCGIIEQLCLLALQGQAPAADHITPILVYVIIQANPPHLLSNIEYIRGFFEKQMTGVDAYWWTQFTSAVEYIKSLFNKV